MFVPYRYVLKCPNCGAGIPFVDLIDKSSFSIRGKVAQCENCNKKVTWSKPSVRVAVWWVCAFTSCVVLYLVITSIWVNLDDIYLAIPVTAAGLSLLFGLRSAKLTVAAS